MNATVLRTVKQAVDVDKRRDPLRQEATWTAEKVVAVDRASAALRAIDDELWR